MKLKIIYSIMIIFLFIGCGYKPITHYTKDYLGNNIFVNIKIDLTDPENSVLLKDAIYEAVLNRLQSKIVEKKKKSTTKLDIKLKRISFKPLQYNKDGYIILYRAKVYLKIKYKIKDFKEKEITSFGIYDFPVEANSILSDIKRFDSIKFASEKALDEFISEISIEAVLKN